MKSTPRTARTARVHAVSPMTIARRGIAMADIIVSKDASATVKHAADELALFLRRVTGGEFRIGQRPGKTGCHLLVGPGAARLADAEFTTKGLGPEEIIIRSTEKGVILAGGEPRGTLYAVFSFLEDCVGCRWWSSSSSTIPATPTLIIAPQKVRYASPLEYRYSFWIDAFDPDWAVRNKSNGPDKLNQPRYGGRMTHGGVHTFFPLIPPQTYFKDHPDWFSLIDGKRTHERAQLCLTNMEMRKQLIANLKDRIRANPAQLVFSVSQNDWAGNCQCDACKALDDAAGSPAGSLLHFVNAVAEEIERDWPHVSISTLAYQYTRKPPKDIRPRPNVIIQLCSIECSFSVPLTDERNRAFRDDIVAWAGIAERLYIWDYVTNFSHHFLPHPNLRVLGPNIRFFVANHAKGIFEQGAYTTRGAEFAELRAWVLARLLWNPRLNDRRLIAEFCNGYYGAAGKHILAYIKLIHDAVAVAGDYSGCFSAPAQGFLSFDVLNSGWKAMQAARKAVAADPVVLNRVAMAELPVMYAFMSNWKALQAQCAAAKAVWPLRSSIQTVAADFKQTATANNVTRVNEWHEGFGLVDKAVAAVTTPEAKQNA